MIYLTAVRITAARCTVSVMLSNERNNGTSSIVTSLRRVVAADISARLNVTIQYTYVEDDPSRWLLTLIWLSLS